MNNDSSRGNLATLDEAKGGKVLTEQERYMMRLKQSIEK